MKYLWLFADDVDEFRFKIGIAMRALLYAGKLK